MFGINTFFLVIGYLFLYNTQWFFPLSLISFIRWDAWMTVTYNNFASIFTPYNSLFAFLTRNILFCVRERSRSTQSTHNFCFLLGLLSIVVRNHAAWCLFYSSFKIVYRQNASNIQKYICLYRHLQQIFCFFFHSQFVIILIVFYCL